MNKPHAAIKQQTGWPHILKIKRLQLQETQATFGKRFDVSDVSVGYWESGRSAIPDTVTWWLTQNPVDPDHVGQCDGRCANHSTLDLYGRKLR